MEVAVLGSGFSGIACAYYLNKSGFKVTVIEKDNKIGGVAGSEEFDAYTLDFGPHIIGLDAEKTISILNDMAPEMSIIRKRIKNSLWYKGSIYTFDFPGLVKMAVKMGRKTPSLARFYLKSALNMKSWKDEDAESWLKRSFGEELYKDVFSPITEWKISSMKNVPASWVATRLAGMTKTGKLYGYPSVGGFGAITENVSRGLEKNDVKFVKGVDVSEITMRNEKFSVYTNTDKKDEDKKKIFDAVISTIPPSSLKTVSPEIWQLISKPIKNISYKKSAIGYYAVKKKERWKMNYCTFFPSDFTFKRLTRTTYYTYNIVPKDVELFCIDNYIPEDSKLNKERYDRDSIEKLETLFRGFEKDVVWKRFIECKYANPIQPKEYWSEEIERTPIKGFGLAGYYLPTTPIIDSGLEACAKSAFSTVNKLIKQLK
ncbi:MAG: FAD-dependent oxidoreductase [Nanoarchaeota archaeon]|nr:FAD-dependent oxidoreductase [Nanoarchaeota archaeon]